LREKNHQGKVHQQEPQAYKNIKKKSTRKSTNLAYGKIMFCIFLSLQYSMVCKKIPNQQTQKSKSEKNDSFWMGYIM
jgi:hypothetical protein